METKAGLWMEKQKVPKHELRTGRNDTRGQKQQIDGVKVRDGGGKKKRGTEIAAD